MYLRITHSVVKCLEIHTSGACGCVYICIWISIPTQNRMCVCQAKKNERNMYTQQYIAVYVINFIV